MQTEAIDTTTTPDTPVTTEDAPKTKVKQAPLNIRRAAKLRSRASQFGQDETVLARWVKHEKEGEITAISNKLTTIQELLEEAAVMYEELPEYLTTPKRGRQIALVAGMVVQAKERYSKDLSNALGGGEVNHLTIISVNGTHALIEDPQGARLHVARRELEPRVDA
jgi:hypothetical protein